MSRNRQQHKVYWKRSYQLNKTEIPSCSCPLKNYPTQDQISCNYPDLFILFQIDWERTGWLGTTITPLPGSRCGLDSWRKWWAIKATAGATISLGNVSPGDDHITMKALCGVLLTEYILTNQSVMWQIIQISTSCLFMAPRYWLLVGDWNLFFLMLIQYYFILFLPLG